MEKLQKWLEVAQQYQKDNFWSHIFHNKGKEIQSALQTRPGFFSEGTYPVCDLFIHEEAMIIEAEVPGAVKEKLKISVNAQILTLSGEAISLVPGRKYLHKERLNGRFEKHINLPHPTINQNIECGLNDGILTIRIPIDTMTTESIPIDFDSYFPG